MAAIYFTYEGNDYMIAENGIGFEVHYENDDKRHYHYVERTGHVHDVYQIKLAEDVAMAQEMEREHDFFLAGTH